MLETVQVNNNSMNHTYGSTPVALAENEDSVAAMRLEETRHKTENQSKQRFCKPNAPLLESDGISFHLANDETSRMLAFELTKREYIRRGLVNPGNMETFSKTASWPNSWTLLALDKKGDAKGTITLLFDGPEELPSDEIFHSELTHLRTSGRRMVEISGFAISHKSKQSGLILETLINLLFLLSRKGRGATDLIIEVHPRHVNFYRRLLGFRCLGKVRPCPRVSGNPAELLFVSLDVYDREAGIPRKDGRRSLYASFMPPENERTVLQLLQQNLPEKPFQIENHGLN